MQVLSSRRASFQNGVLACLCISLLAQGVLGTQRERVAKFYKATVITKAKLGPVDSGALSGRLLKEQEKEVVQAFLVGYEAAEEDAVAAKLASLGTSEGIIIVQPVPDDHWIVKAKQSEIEALQAAYPSVTAALLPSNVKASDDVDVLLNSLQQVSVASASSGPTSPAWLDKVRGLELHQTPDGQVQVVLSLQATPFVSMGAAARGEADLAAANADAAAWAADLAQGLASQLRLHASDPCAPLVTPAWVFGAATVRVCASHAPLAAEWLLAQPTMVWLDLQRGITGKDLHSSAAVQDGAVRAALRGGARSHLNLMKYWTKGLTGKGQISGVTDTGIDMDSCHFWDPSFTDYQTNNVQTTRGDRQDFEQFKSSSHRKVDAYFFFGNKVDDSNHGTHVASTLAGSAWNPRTNRAFNPLQDPDYATGIAPEARLSFFDIESRQDAQDNVLSIPNGIEMFHAMYRQGVRIISNSWGGNTGNYDSMCVLYDLYTWILQDLMLVAAAGNEGLTGSFNEGITVDDWRKGTMSVPGACKNVMSVGAAENWSGPIGASNAIRLLDTSGNQVNPPNNYFRSVGDRDGRPVEYAVEFKAFDAQGTEKGQLLLRLGDGISRWPSQGSLQGLDGRELEVVRAGSSPFDACDTLDSSNYQAGRMLVFSHSSTCSQQQQANNIINNGNDPAGGILVDARSVLSSAPSVSLADNTKVFGYIGGSNRLMELLGGEGVTTTKMRVFQISPHENVATFSSFGALAFADRSIRDTQDLRTQPTVVAPGYALSANGNGFRGVMDRCEVASLPGSSMATPVAAGMATLIRQYFMDGYYPSGDQDSSNGFEPTAALLQAVVVGGTEAMIGNRGTRNSNFPQTSGPLAGLPSQGRLIGQHTGWGRVSLRGLKLNGAEFDPDWGLQVIQKASHDRERQKHVYSIQATAKGPLIVTMVYMDFPANPNVRPLLVNDLNLKVIGPSGSGTQDWWGNEVRNGDAVNNIEKVVIDYPAAGEYTIEVHSAKLFRDARPQPYALAIMGGIEGEMDSPFNPARLSSAARQPGEGLAGDVRMLRVRFNVDDQTQALQVVSNSSHLDFQARTLSAFQAKADASIVASIQLFSASMVEPLEAKRRQLLQTPALVTEYEFRSVSGSTAEALADHMSQIIQDFPLADASAMDGFFGTGFGSDFLVTSVEGAVMAALDMDSVFSPPAAELPGEASSARGMRTGPAALLGCALLALLLGALP